MKTMTRFTQLAIILMLIALLAACGGNNNGNAEPNPPSAVASSANSTGQSPADDNAVRTMKDAMGHDVQVPAHPKKVLAPFLEDPLTALGLKPIAQWGAAGVPQQYLQDELKDVPVLNMEGGMKPEEALSYSPDLIIFLAPTYLADGSYEQFAKIAPTYVLSDNEADWRGNLQKLGTLLNEEDAVKAALGNFDKKVQEAKAKLGTIPAEKTAVLLQADGEKGFKLFGPNFYGGETLYKTLGFKQPSIVTGDYDTFSIEKLADLKDVDYIFVISGPGRGKPPVDNSLWKSLQAVRNNQVFEADSGHWFNANIIANGLMIDDVLKDVHE
ncbi:MULTISPECIES: ABC transporter substrate-binding protein [unclassified Paenibacillus]|uniref:ABC transporter substrate-binding protein n=1 Tax=unclassified Paenibacillus TaxID=185978 RepID=UPI00104F81AC|nr:MULTISPECIES: ABC transporter substrate-binding protein [unclassified Paenibacillus]NIK71767.1 iron complex transport system substrate-binding protein [Paenibacillus sp. BK720]TCM96417.1 iron complex transport system substrate-binding protein [Paenibacillus sp. BK033]